MEMEPSQAKQTMEQLEQEMPEMAQLVKQKIQQIHQQGGTQEAPEGGAPQGGGQQTDMRPLPEQKPPQRERSPI